MGDPGELPWEVGGNIFQAPPTTRPLPPIGRHAKPRRGERYPDGSNKPWGTPAFEAGIQRSAVAGPRNGPTGWHVRSTCPLLFSPARTFPLAWSKVAPQP